MVAVGIRLVCIVMYILYNNVYILLYIPPLGNVFPAKVNDSMIIRDSMSLGGEGECNVSAKW